MSEDGDVGEEQRQDPQVEYLQQLLRENEFLQREHLLFESFLSKVDLSKLGVSLDDEKQQKKKPTKKGKGVEIKKETFQRLTDEEKNDLVSQEIELVQNEINSIKKAGEKDIDDIKTLMEEVDMRIAETKKDTYEFKRDIIIASENPRSGKVVAEKMIRFMEDKLRAKDATIDKLRLKNTTTKALITKLEHQLAHKEEMGEVLHLVDFDQLKIENQQYMEKIEERNSELLKLKLSTSRTVQVLNDLKSRLSELSGVGVRLRRQIAERQADLSRFGAEHERVEEQLKRSEVAVRKLRAEQDDIDNPSIVEYIKLKHDVMELEKQLVDLKRKVSIYYI
uniref:Cilia- and flagella-associated protein 263 n=1 Tax=Polytomella parva TaxID=51329 RepID=A0A7S0UUC6_9CHLO|mmetsp:Transcript_22454/g.39840  ORF Transcript_22454/g.39840 Transcript_22454/m.39840 type:complete len:336 (+) Transcript_22454:115-1122(+)